MKKAGVAVNDHSPWLAKLARLRIDTASGAPHKPLLLLVVLDLAEQRAFGPDVLPLTPQLAFRFCSYWQIVAHRRKQKPVVRWPFTKLKTEGVWLPFDEHGEPAAACLDAELTFCEWWPIILVEARLRSCL